MLEKQDGVLRVNFDPKIVALLREVRYLDSFQVSLPATATNIYSKSDTFRNFIFQLDHISTQYNGIRTDILDVEKPLIQAKVDAIDKELEKALSSMSWQSNGIEEYITSISTTVTDLFNILQITKNNIMQIQRTMKAWSATPLIERKDSKKMLNLEEKDVRLSTIFEMIKRDGISIHETMLATKNAFQISEQNEGSEEWLNYLNYVDGLVKDGFRTTIKNSLAYLIENTDPSENKSAAEISPLLEAKLELDNDLLLFTPSMDESKLFFWTADNFYK